MRNKKVTVTFQQRQDGTYVVERMTNSIDFQVSNLTSIKPGSIFNRDAMEWIARAKGIEVIVKAFVR